MANLSAGDMGWMPDELLRQWNNRWQLPQLSRKRLLELRSVASQAASSIDVTNTDRPKLEELLKAIDTELQTRRMNRWTVVGALAAIVAAALGFAQIYVSSRSP